MKYGTRGSVEAVGGDRRSLLVRTDAGIQVRLNARYLEAGHLRHAYAPTGHAGQAVVLGGNRLAGGDVGHRVILFKPWQT